MYATPDDQASIPPQLDALGMEDVGDADGEELVLEGAADIEEEGGVEDEEDGDEEDEDGEEDPPEHALTIFLGWHLSTVDINDNLLADQSLFGSLAGTSSANHFASQMYLRDEMERQYEAPLKICTVQAHPL